MAVERREVFDRIYRDKFWGEGSGGGSGAEVSKPFADVASKLIRDHQLWSVLDIGCGDGWAATHIDLSEVAYLGIDVSAEIIERCREMHPGRIYAVADAIEDELPSASLVLLKEVTQHLSDADVHRLIARLSAYAMVLHCSAVELVNAQMDVTGGTRPVNLALPPFSLETTLMGAWEYGGTVYHAELWRPGK